MFNKINTLQVAIKQMLLLVWKANPNLFIVLLLLQILYGILPSVSALLNKLIFDGLGEHFRNESLIDSSLFYLCILYILLSFIIQFVSFIANFLNSDLQRDLSILAQSNLYQSITSLKGIKYFEDPTFYDTVRLASQSVQHSPSQVLISSINILKNSLTLLSFIGILFLLSPALGFGLILASIPGFFVQLKISKKRFNIVSLNSPKERLLFYLSNVLTSVEHAKEVQIFNLGQYFIDRLLATQQEINSAQRSQQLEEIKLQSLLALFSNIINGMAFLFIVNYVYRNVITIGDLTLYTIALFTSQSALAGIVSNINILAENTIFFQHYRKLLSTTTSTQSNSSKEIAIPNLQESIEIRNLSFRYSENSNWIFKDLNLTIPKGKTLALVGLNGAGKSTLVKLLTRLYAPTSGQILWDSQNINGFDEVAYRYKIGVIFQDFVQYDLSARNNIGVGNVEEINSFEKIQKAARLAGADKLLENLPYKYDTILSRWLADKDNGTDLSGGEWQKIALARSFMRDRDFLILDEPTSSFDVQAEYEMYKQFTELIKGSTSLLISHRFSTVRMADIIAVLENGQITEYGPHTELMLLNGTYAKLYSMQEEQYALKPSEIQG